MSRESAPEGAGAVGLLTRIERVALSLTLLLTGLACAPGLSRFDSAKLAALTIGGVLCATLWLVGFMRKGHTTRLGGGWLAGLGWLVTLYVGLSLFWSDDPASGKRGLLMWSAGLSVYISAASAGPASKWVIRPLQLAALGVAGLVIAARFGFDLIPPIPTGMAGQGGGAFDHPLFAGFYLAIVAPVALLGMARDEKPAAAAFGALTLLASAMAIGVTGGLATVLLLASILLGSAASAPSLRALSSGRAKAVVAAALASLLCVGLGFSLGAKPVEEPAPGEASVVLELSQTGFASYRIDHSENVVTTSEEWSFERERAFRIAGEESLLGAGIGSWARLAGRGLDPEHPYYAEHRDTYHIHDTPPGLLLSAPVELGLLGAALVAAFLLLGLWTAGRSVTRVGPGGGYAAAGVLAGVVLVVTTSAGAHAGEWTALMATLGLAVGLDERAGGLFSLRRIGSPKNGVAKAERWILVVVPAVAVLVFSGVGTGRFILSDKAHQSALVFLEHGMNEDGLESLECALGYTDQNAEAMYHLGVARFFTPTDDARRAGARAAAERAATLRPNDVRFRFMALRTQGGGDESSAARSTREKLNAFQSLIPLDPDNTHIYREMARGYSFLQDFEAATRSWLEVAERAADPEEAGRALFDLGELYEDQVEDPERALRYYGEAMERFAPGSRWAERTGQRLLAVQAWIETGSRRFEAPPTHDH